MRTLLLRAAWRGHACGKFASNLGGRRHLTTDGPTPETLQQPTGRGSWAWLPYFAAAATGAAGSAAYCSLQPGAAVVLETKEGDKNNVKSEEVKKPAAAKAKKPSSSTAASPKSANELFYGHLLQRRIVVANGRVDDTMANDLMLQFLYLEGQDPKKPITLYINSPGGRVSSGLAIYDIMQEISPPVHTVAVGHAQSMGAILLAAGEPGHRWALPHAHIMVHQPSHSMSGKTTDISIRARYAEGLAHTLTEILAKHTGKPYAEVAAGIRDDNNLSATEALEYGLIDHIGSPTAKRTADKSGHKEP